MKPSILPTTVEGFRQRLANLERSVTDLQRMAGSAGGSERIGGAEPAAASSGGVPTFYVAASNATDRSKEFADYICDGTDDEVEINDALAFRGGTFSNPVGPRVVLSEGEFYLTAAIGLPWPSELRGLGWSTILYPTTTAIAAEGRCTISDMHIIGPTGGKGVTILYEDATVSNVNFESLATGVETVADRTHILACRFAASSSGTPYAIDITGGVDSLVQGCYLKHDLRIAASRTLVVGNRFGSGSAITITSGSVNAFASNYVPNGAADVTDSGTGSQFATNFSGAGIW